MHDVLHLVASLKSLDGILCGPLAFENESPKHLKDKILWNSLKSDGICQDPENVIIMAMAFTMSG